MHVCKQLDDDDESYHTHPLIGLEVALPKGSTGCGGRAGRRGSGHMTSMRAGCAATATSICQNLDLRSGATAMRGSPQGQSCCCWVGVAPPPALSLMV